MVTSNVLGAKLKTGTPIQERDLAEVQRQREMPTRFIQTFQSFAQRAVSAGVLNRENDRMLTVPRFVLPLLRIPWLLALPAQLIGYGLCPPHVKQGQ